MITQTRTTTLNAAFLKDIKDDNVQFRKLLREVESALSVTNLNRIRAHTLSGLLGRLRDQLATHFALEEYFGYFDDALEVAPRLSNQAEILRSQHATLFTEICEVAEAAEKRLYGESRMSVHELSEMFLAFHKRLLAHEECENELIMQALNDDIGVGD